MKRCYKCGEIKDESEFGKDSSRKDGLSNACKSCHAESSRKYRERNRDKVNEKARQRWSENKELNAERHKKYYEQNKAKVKEKVSEWRKNNPDIVNKYAANSRKKSRERLDSFKTPCVKCGETRPWVIAFHHIDPSTKEFSITSHRSCSELNLLKEVEKCVCLCRNCHAEFHYMYGNNPKNPANDLDEYLKSEVNE